MSKRKRLTKGQRRRKLAKNAKEEQSFVLADGNKIRNLIDLAEAMETISHELYSQHVNEEKNDFSTWTKEVIGEKTLARNLLGVSDKTQAQITILKHIVKNTT